MAAHFALLCAGIYPSFPQSAAGHNENDGSQFAGLDHYVLLGCDASKSRNLNDVIGINSLVMTQILELVIQNSIPGISGSAGSSFTLGGLFGWGSSSSTATSNGSKSNGSRSDKGDQDRHVLPRIPDKAEYYNLRTLLCPIKIRYAMFLCDLGLTEQAQGLVSAVQQVAHDTENDAPAQGEDIYSLPFPLLFRYRPYFYIYTRVDFSRRSQ